MWLAPIAAILGGTALAWFIFFLIALAVFLWFLSWLLFPESNPIPVNESLQGLDGMNETMAGRLASFGVSNDTDLIRLTPRGQQELESQLGLHQGEYDNWRQEVLDRWRTKYLPESFRSVPDITPDPELGGVYAKKPKQHDDLTKLEGIDKVSANRMNHAGIYTFEQLRLMTPEQRACFKQRFNLPQFNFGGVPDYGITAQWLAFQREQQLSGKAPSIPLQRGDASTSQPIPSTATDSKQHVRIDPATTGLTAAGLAAGLTAGKASATSEQSHGTSPSSSSPAKTGAQTTRPTPVDSTSTQHASARKAVDANVVTSLKSGAAAQPAANPKQSSTQRDHESGIVAGSSGAIPKTRIDADLGRVYTSPPPHKDDLTQLDGIAEADQVKLNLAGIYTVDQLMSLTPAQRSSFKHRFDLPHFSFSRGSSSGTGSSVPRPHFATSQHGSSKQDVGTNSSQTSDSELKPIAGTNSKNVDLGFVYVSRPSQVDDLARLEGISPEMAKKLNEAGIYKFSQIHNMSDKQKQNVRTKYGVPFAAFSSSPASSSVPSTSPGTNYASSGNVDLKTVAGFASGVSSGNASPPSDSSVSPSSLTSGGTSSSRPTSSGTPGGQDKHVTKPVETGIRMDPSFGLVYTFRPKESDQLERLPGIDPATAKQLNDAGIYRFQQIENLTPAQQAALRVRFGLDEVNFNEWKRLMHAWARGFQPSVAEPPLAMDKLHGIALPLIVPGVFDGKQLVAYPEQVVFRGTEPKHWGTSMQSRTRGAEKSLVAADIRNDINYVRIRRTDTRESVVTEVQKSQLFAPGPDGQNGWNGLCERFFGARHLGVFASQIAAEVETKFGTGGWGFGHKVDQNDGQEYCWHGRLIPKTAFEISVGRVGPAVGTVVFRSSDPSIWNSSVRNGHNRFAAPIESVRHPVAYVRIMRVDTGQAVIVRTDPAEVTLRDSNRHIGWNGLNEQFFGGHHLGAYHRDAPQEVEIAYGEGGWGFGHPYHENDIQAYGWGGERLPETVFEISLLEHVPDRLRHELIE